MSRQAFPRSDFFLPHRLDHWANTESTTWSLTFLDSRGQVDETWDARKLRAKTCAIAAELRRTTEPGEPVLLVFDPSPTFLAAFMACLWSGRPATPINPPRRNRLVERLQSVAADSGARTALTSSALADAVPQWRQASPALARLEWTFVEGLADTLDDASTVAAPAPVAADDLAFIQYTSGSTSSPKGVRVTHGNLHYDMEQMAAAWLLAPSSTMVTWLPAFHDLGLIFGLLLPLHIGCATVQMAPNTFLQRPRLWLEAITRFQGTHTAAPSFAYDLCCRRIPPEQRRDLDLSSLVMAMNAAEPINPEVMERFSSEFADCGFSWKAFAPAYGLAESTLAVTANPTGEPPVIRHFDAADLERHQARCVEISSPGARAIVGCGRPLPGVPLVIADPESQKRCLPGQIGEIWVGGPTIAHGYWQRPDATADTFGCTLEGEGPTPYLRTGDLGVLVDGELFVTGRIKDLIILSGVNHYPQDIERAAQRAHAALRSDGGAAFALVADDGNERVVLVQELERTRRNDEPDPIFRAVLDEVWRELELPLWRIALLSPGGLLRTSSGKIQRGANRDAWLAGRLPVIAEWSGATPGRPLVPRAVATSRDETELAEWVCCWLARHLEVPRARIDARQGFADLGLDSAGAVELSVDLGHRLGRELPETLCFDHPSVSAVVAYVFRVPQHDARSDAGSSGSATPVGGGSDLLELLAQVESDKA